MLEISIWSSNFVMSDNCIGSAGLVFNNSSETGTITNWLKLKTLKNDQQMETGELFVSISKEKIAKSQLMMGLSQDIMDSRRQPDEQFYSHLVQNTEECRAHGGDQDEKIPPNDVEHPIINFEGVEGIVGYGHGGLHSQKRFGPEEVPDDDDEEALQSPIDDVQNDLINMQK